ncbi:MAG: Lipid flippase Amj [Verrucomicrobiales bacterium]|nr:Lipid flippase Amj [Verrucomicrobiales bacterium]
MDIQLGIICILTFVIHLIGTLAYSVRIAGIRTRRIAVSFALFNVLVLVSRTSNSFQGPFLAKRVEENLAHPQLHHLLSDFRWVLVSATLATLLGALCIPTFQRLFSRAVMHFQVHRSILRLLIYGFFHGGIRHVRNAASVPALANFTQLNRGRGVTPGVIILNIVAVALWTVGVFAALYAGYLNPEVRVTAITLASIVNGAATVLMFVFIDPQMSMMTDDVVEGHVSEPSFRRAVVWLVGSRFAGTLLAQLLLIPAATLIAFVAQHL